MSQTTNVVGPISEGSKLGVPRGRLEGPCPEVVVIFIHSTKPLRTSVS